MKKILIIISLIWLLGQNQVPPPTVYFLNVGQGLAVLYRHSSGFTMLYDTGPGRAVAPELGTVLPPWQRQIDLIIISHTHADHLDGLLAVLEQYSVREVWLPALPDNELGRLVGQKLTEQPDINVRRVTAGTCRILPGGDQMIVWHPATAGQTEHAGTQVVSLTDATGNRLLLTGDLDAADEIAALNYCRSHHICATASQTVLQVSHHGSKTSTSLDWLEAVRPNLAVISVGENSYGHPSDETIERLRSLGIPLKRTDQTGRVLTELSLQR